MLKLCRLLELLIYLCILGNHGHIVIRFLFRVETLFYTVEKGQEKLCGAGYRDCSYYSSLCLVANKTKRHFLVGELTQIEKKI